MHRDEEAISAQMAVVLMVAVMFVLIGALAFLIQTVLPDSQAAPPAVTFGMDEQRDRVLIVSAPDDVLWDDIVITTSSPTRAALGSADSSSQLVGDGLVLSGPMEAGSLSFCGTDGSSGVTHGDVTILLRHTPTNRLMFSGMFASINACT